MDDQKRSIEELSQVIVLQQKIDALTLAVGRQQAMKNKVMAMPSEQSLPAKGQ